MYFNEKDIFFRILFNETHFVCISVLCKDSISHHVMILIHIATPARR